MILETGLVAAFAAAAASRTVYTLQPGQSAVKMFLGKVRGYETTPGLHLKAPWESLTRLETKQKYEDIDLENVKTEDGYFVNLPVQVQYRIVEPDKYLFGADDPEEQMFSVLENAIRSQVSKMKFDELYTSKDALEQNIEAHEKTKILETFGIELVGIVPGDPQPDEAVLDAINERIREIEVATGHKRAQILEGEGIAGKQAAIFEKYAERMKSLQGEGVNMDPSSAEAFIVLSMAYDTINTASSHGNMVLASSDAGGIMGQFAAIVNQLQSRRPIPGSLAAPVAAPAPVAEPPAPEV